MSGPADPDRDFADGVAPHGNDPSALAAAAAVVALLVALGWLVVSNVGSGGSPDRATDPPPPPAPSPTVAGTEGSAPHPYGASGATGGALAGCRRLVAAQDHALRPAAAALDLWQADVGARNKFGAGVVTTARLVAFWDRNGHDTARQLASFRAEVRQVRRLSDGCRRLSGRGIGDARLLACAEAATARRTVLRAARTSVHDWVVRQPEVQALRDGRLSAQEVRAAWLPAVPSVVRDLKAYRHAVRELRDASVCRR